VFPISPERFRAAFSSVWKIKASSQQVYFNKNGSSKSGMGTYSDMSAGRVKRRLQKVTSLDFFFGHFVSDPCIDHTNFLAIQLLYQSFNMATYNQY
jgi:hypothetical protein